MTQADRLDALSSGEQDRIDAEARRWLLAADDPRFAVEADAWRAADPRHDSAYRKTVALWDAIERTEVAGDDGWRNEAIRLERRAGLKRLIAPTALAASLVAAVVLGWPASRTPAGERFATTTAQTRTLALMDGSRLFVGARSAVKVRLGERRRDVDMEDGEAFFEVAKDPTRPFYVHAGETTIRVVGTKFNVVRNGDDVRVSVLEGRVEVSRRPAPDLPRGASDREIITGGQSIRTYDQSGAGLRVASVGVAEPGSWRAGRLLYADTPLKEIVADANRYSMIPIRLASDEVGDMRVTTTFRTESVDDLVANLGRALPLKSTRSADGTIVLARDRSR